MVWKNSTERRGSYIVAALFCAVLGASVAAGLTLGFGWGVAVFLALSSVANAALAVVLTSGGRR